MSDERGFTLIEVLVAASLLIVSVLATLAMLDNATKTTAQGKQRDVANAVAQEMIERAAGGRYTISTTGSRNDLTDVDTAAALPGPADRLRAGMDPDSDQGSTAVTPATVTSGTLPVNVAQSWSVQRKNTTYTVSYRACTASDTYEQVQIAGPFDCSRSSATDPPAGSEQGSSGACGVGAPTGAAPPGQIQVKLQVLGISGLNACLATASSPLATALCNLLGGSVSLQNISSTLMGAGGLLASTLGGLAGLDAGCSPTQVDTVLAGARSGIGASTKLAVTVAWTELSGNVRSISQTSLIRRGEA